jgi:DNA repair protein SbcC/Rad50
MRMCDWCGKTYPARRTSEGELGWWNLLGKALGNDGVIALCVDDAGPELAWLTNELLLACYGPRFTVSIRTQVETVRKELREGFDVVVFDADTGQAKSVAVMSGGERIWINQALTRAIALYLARSSGRRYETLFCPTCGARYRRTLNVIALVQ